MTNITVRGQTINNTLIAAYVKRISSLNDTITVFANAATLQAVQHGNRNWLDKLFDLPIMRMSSGALSKQGKLTLGYIAAHCPRVVFDPKSNKVGVKKVHAESIMAHNFLVPGVTEAQAADIEGVEVVNDKIVRPFGDFYLTYNDFLAMAKPEKEEEETQPTLSAKAFLKQIEKAATFQADNRLIGSADEVLAIEAHLKQLLLKVSAQHAKMVAEVVADATKQVDATLAAQLLQSGQAGKSKRAGGKTGQQVAA